MVTLCVVIPAIPAIAAPPELQVQVELEKVAVSDRRWTGIAVARDGRVFVNYPRWSPEVPLSVGELMADGTVRPYPDAEMNSWQVGDDPGQKFVCVQSVVVDQRGRLWILDPANPLFMGVVENGAKLMQVDLETDQIVQTIVFGRDVTPAASYLNDVRIDTGAGTAYITESGLGSLVVVDLQQGKARRLLADHPSTKAENFTVQIGEVSFPMQVHADGIALDADEGWLYYQALTGRTLYRLPTAALRDTSLSDDELAARIESFARSGVSDGLLHTPEGIYVSALEDNSIKLVDRQGAVRTVVRNDDLIRWPDSFARGADGHIWFTTSLIHLGPAPASPFRILKFRPPPLVPPPPGAPEPPDRGAQPGRP